MRKRQVRAYRPSVETLRLAAVHSSSELGPVGSLPLGPATAFYTLNNLN